MEKHLLEKSAEERKMHLLSIGKQPSWPEAGRIFCEKEYIYCARVDLLTGACTVEKCNITDPDYIQTQIEINKRMQEAHQKTMTRKEIEKPETGPKIRKQNKTKQELIDTRIKRLQDMITMHYKYARPHKAVKLELEVRRLEQEKRLLEQPLIKSNHC